MKAVIIGRGEMLSNLIEGTLDAECEIVGVMRYERVIYSPFTLWFRDFFVSSPEYTLIKEHKIHEIKCRSANSECFKKELLRLNADILLVGSWCEKLTKEILDTPVIASVNAHPSYLPKYRGPNPYLRTIANMEEKSGITFHLMDENYDSGAILAQTKVDILPGYTGKELKERTVLQARLLASEVLKKLEYGLITPVPQDESNATCYPNININDTVLNFKNKTAEEISAQIRGFHPWAPTYIVCGKKFLMPNPYKLEVTKAEQEPGTIITSDPKTRSLTIACKDNTAIKMAGLKLYRFGWLTGLFLRTIKV